ncbi:alpha/beta hydrolase [Corynebacterium qintianiae]|uniref:alpha/beta hydrolase n=1 Tax=Corynebacterium qintianiae TaxID=2709392 RepID=UPI0013EAC5B6|nr:alpha/beta hydrolase [Corynebacterium qintianiae]
MAIQNALSAVAAAALRTVPNPVLSLLGTTTTENGTTMAPDVRVSSLALKYLSRDFSELPINEARGVVESDAKLGAGPHIAVGPVWDSEIAGIPVRHYRPQHCSNNDQPTVVYFHGGGWATGSLETHDNTCRFLCANADVAVISVDYPLAPEHRYPAAPDAAFEVLDAVMSGALEGVDSSRVAVAGDSAGASLATVACLRRADRDMPQPELQVLFVPCTNLDNFDTSSHNEFATGTYLTRKQMEWFRDLYTSDGDDLSSWDISPLRAPVQLLSKLAPAYISVAGFDPLRDEGIAYARKLADAHVPVTLEVNKGLVHPFANAFYVWEGATAAMSKAAGAIRFALRVTPR